MSIIVSDYDGTFSTSERDIKINCELLRNYIKEGNYFVLSSGRPLDSLMRQVCLHKIPYTHLGTSDGNFLFDKNGKKLDSYTISHDIVPYLKEISKLKIYEHIQYAYPRKNTEKYNEKGELGSISFVIREERLSRRFLYLFNKLKKEHPEYQYDIYSYSGIYYYMVRPMGVNKGSPIATLSQKLNIDKKDIYTIGDNTNDIEMVKDYNGFMIGNNKGLEKVALKKYNAVHELIKDIQSKKVKKRW